MNLQLTDAAKQNDLNGVIQALALKADPDIRDSSGLAAIHYACQHQNLQILRLLLEAGAAPNLQTSDGHSPLDLTLWHGEISMGVQSQTSQKMTRLLKLRR
ncbi:ankyrin repeat domain-containing protein [Shewanella submarina]|uniref:Ankyrin repeat domain-containing protein n=1 Tax=Shewanella submarina TaxID=2016376 RepID=A0ABV7GHU5_9GAMM|nr:ankyrin repeat domain-containing protein [Shewanella submarina]MCL1038278.1 ankyrin repeat domain-containing protein [Shewanella submarina]